MARLQALFTSALLLGILSWTAFFLTRGLYVVASAAILVTAVAYASILAAQFGLIVFFNFKMKWGSPTPSQLSVAFVAEFIQSLEVFCWRQPFRSRAEPDFLVPESAKNRGVLLLHGFLCNRGFWNPWMTTFRAHAVPFISLNLEPSFGSIDTYRKLVESAVRRLELATGFAPVVVGHSMGGLAARAWLADAGNGERVHRVVTIATPHHGTWLARFARTRNGVEMRTSSSFVQTLAARESAADRGRFICFYGNCDNVVFPASSAELPGADNRHVPGTAHIQMAFHRDVIREVLRCVASPVPRGPS